MGDPVKGLIHEKEKRQTEFPGFKNWNIYWVSVVIFIEWARNRN